MTHETLEVLTTSSGGAPLGPGELLRALHHATGACAEEVGGMFPSGRGRLSVEIEGTRAHRIATPLVAVWRAEGRALALGVGRPDDPARDGSAWLAVEHPGAARPGPGAVARALAEASGGLLGGEDLGVGLPLAGELRLEAPSALWLAGRVPTVLEVEGQPMPTRTVAGGLP